MYLHAEPEPWGIDNTETDPDILNIVLGKNVPGIDPEQMCNVWICAGKAISAMYYNILKSRTGIG